MVYDAFYIKGDKMRAIVKALEMKAYDNYTIEKIEISSLLLMERAALAVVNAIRDKIHKNMKVLVVAGNGNNGGDALAAGRMLVQEETEVYFCMPGLGGKVSKETEKQIKILQNLGFSIHDKFPEEEYDIVIDGLFGIGLTRTIEGIYKEAVMNINALKENGAYVVSCDIPSGICADTGKILGCGVKADVTVTFQYAKAGHYFYPGREYTGALQIASIGIVGEKTTGLSASYQTMEETDVKELLPVREPAGNKGTFGKVLLMAGSKDMCGAAVLCGKAVLHTGAGMVKVITPQENRGIIQQSLPEAMLYTYEGMPEADSLSECIRWADVIVAGPGIGKSEASQMILTCLLQQGKKPFVADADALNLIAENSDLQKAVCSYSKNQLIITPHPGELIRLCGLSMMEYKHNPQKYIRELADDFSCIVVGKDAVTMVAQPEEEKIYMNLNGNDGMATAGSGDVLAGIIGGLLAQQVMSEKAAVLGVYLHGRAGDKAADKKSRYAVTASDLIEYLW